MTKRPNFLFIITDQQRADWLGCYGHPVLKTPNIDSIAAQGTRFDNFHAASPVCMPNRASLLTGRYPSLHGLRYNGCVLPDTANTFVDTLSNAGYDTAAIGTVVTRAPSIQVPWLLVHGTADDVIPLQDSLDILERANEPKQLVRIDGADHVFSEHTQDMVKVVHKWVRGQLERT